MGSDRAVGSAGRVTTGVIAVRIPDWQVRVAGRAAGIDADVPTAAHDGRRVVAASAVARARGVSAGMRRRAAQEACPDLELIRRDRAAETAELDGVAAAVEKVVSRVVMLPPGIVWARLPAEAGGGVAEVEELARNLTDAVAAGTGDECVVGAAGSVFAAVVATGEGLLIPVDRTVAYLRGRPVGVLRQMIDDDRVRHLVELLDRLGVRTLGDLQVLPARTVHARFGGLGLWAYRMACGEDEPAVRVWQPDQPLMVNTAVDPPALRSDAVTFLAAPLAEELQRMLEKRSVTCALLRITARTANGGELTRCWQAGTPDGSGEVKQTVDRVRWQLDGWLSRGRSRAVPGAASSRAMDDPDIAPIIALELVAEEVIPVALQHQTLWEGTEGKADDHRARRVIDRIQGMLGADVVLAAVVQGGRTPMDRVRLVPWGQPVGQVRPVDRPWPGSLPPPSPATVLRAPVPVDVQGEDGRAIQVGERLGMSGEPRFVKLVDRERHQILHQVLGAERQSIVGWAGPWPLAERWWTVEGRRMAYLQVAVAAGPGMLLGCRAGTWTCEAVYD